MSLARWAPSRIMRRRAMAVGVGVLIAAVAMAYVLSRPPRWWNPPARSNPAAIAAGETLENATVTEVHRVRAADEPWSVRVRDSDVNAWLATRLPKWVEHAGSGDSPQAMVRFRPGSIDVAARVDGLPSVGVLRCSPRIDDGALRLDVVRARLGELPVPFLRGMLIGPLEDALRDPEAPDEVRMLATLLAGEAVTPRFSLGDGRLIELRAVEVDDGELRLEFVTKVERRTPRG
jgi:hypothetical protein